MTAAARRSSRSEYTISGTMNLGDLRWLVQQCEGMNDSARVTTTEYRSHTPLDWDEASIKVSGDPPR